nr:hypothetical protein [Methylorubrum zatmanii]
MADDPQDRHILTGTPFGAFRFATLGKLFGSQRVALTAIVEAIHRIAAESHKSRRGKPASTPNENDLLSLEQDAYFVRPHHAYVIDGERGSGKTTVLLTLYGYIKAMRLDNARAPAPENESDTIRSDLAKMQLPPVPGADGNERTALLLPIVFPETMEPHESAMEAVFAHMDQILVRAIADTKIDADRRRRLDELQSWLRRRIGSAWMYSRNIGEQALTNDALTYDEFVLRRAEHNRRSYTRIDTWRYFVDRYLDELGYEVLVLSFDDSDLVPEAADDIMRTIRVYLSHARIVSLLAVEFRTLQETLSLFKLTQRSPGLLASDSTRLNGLMELESSNVAAQLDKILPTGLRYRLETAADQLDNIFDGDFANFCQTRFYRDLPTSDGRRKALSWWLLSGPYSGLVSDTVRRIVSVRAGAQRSAHDIDAVLLEYSKFTDINTIVGGRLSGIRDAILGGKVRRGGLIVGQPNINSIYFEVQRRPLTPIESSLIEFVLDRELANRNLNTAAVPEIGRWLALGQEDEAGEDDVNSAFEPRAFDSSRSVGVAALFPNLLLPRNCLYLADLRFLDEVDWKLPSPQVAWVARLVSRSRIGNEEVRRDIGRAIRELSTLDDEGALRWLLFQFDALRRGANRYQRSATLRQILQDPSALPETLLILLEIVASGGARSRLDLIMALEDASEHGQIKIPIDRPFSRVLAEFLDVREDMRRSAIQVWVNALKIARQTRALGALLNETVLDDGTTLVNGTTLFEQTIEALSDGSDPRAAALLAWSLDACITPIFDTGFALRSMSPSRSHWERLVQALRVAAEGARPTIRESRPDNPRRQRQHWRFPDIEAGERKAIVEAVDAAIVMIERRLAVGGLAAAPAPTQWPSDPAELMALLLGMTVQAVETSGVLHAG